MFFVGNLLENCFHKHYALQICISSTSDFILNTVNLSLIGNSFFINSNIKHQLIATEPQLTILINPLSSIAHWLFNTYGNNNFLSFNDNFSNQLRNILKDFLNHKTTFKTFKAQISDSFINFNCFCKKEIHIEDQRILKAFHFMKNNFDKVLSLEEVAAHCNLSKTRFLHLFKENTNLSFRRCQLWNKIIKSIPY